MSLPTITDQEEWRRARLELLEREKEMTRARDALSTARRELPMVEIEKDYRFAGPDGEAGLADLFEGRRQLIVVHFMFDPEWEDGCPSCTAGADEVSDGMRRHLANRDTTLAFVSRAPLEKLARYRAKMGWTFPWYSSHGSEFNYDFHVTLDAAVAPVEYNWKDEAELVRMDPAWEGWTGEQPGRSCFLRDGERVFHTYSSFARGAEWTGGSYAYLDLTALGRQEAWEEPKDRVDTDRDATPDMAA